MDRLVDWGSQLFCGTLHAVGTASFEMQACGSSADRFTAGILMAFTMTLLGAVIACWFATRIAR